MDSGFGGINARLDRLNGKTEAHGKDIVRLETLLDERERAANKDTTARLGGFVGAVVGGVALVWQWMGK